MYALITIFSALKFSVVRPPRPPLNVLTVMNCQLTHGGSSLSFKLLDKDLQEPHEGVPIWLFPALWFRQYLCLQTSYLSGEFHRVCPTPRLESSTDL
jgi:hypothetical protein